LLLARPYEFIAAVFSPLWWASRRKRRPMSFQE
jgi:hypothetical protein